MNIVCTKYPGNCTISTEFCSRRYQKATFNPDDMSLDPCRDCTDGKKAFAEWKKSFKGQTTQEEKQFSDMPVVKKKPYKCRFCETPTGSADRICLKCQIEGKTAPTEEAKSVEQRAKSEKKDIQREHKCKEESMGTSSHKKCRKDDCKRQAWKDGMCYRHFFIEHPEEKKAGKPKSLQADKLKTQVSRGEPAINKGKDIGMTRGNPSIRKTDEPENIKQVKVQAKAKETNNHYLLTVDFSKYPQLHQRLISKAEEEYRTPELQLLYHLNYTFQDMEAKLAE